MIFPNLPPCCPAANTHSHKCTQTHRHIHTLPNWCYVLWLVTQSCSTLCHPTDCSPLDSSVHGDSPGKNTGLGCHALLQGSFPTQALNPGLLHCRQILYHLSHQGSPRTLRWVTYPFSRGTSRPRNRTRVSCIAGRFFTNWATREALPIWYLGPNTFFFLLPTPPWVGEVFTILVTYQL